MSNSKGKTPLLAELTAQEQEQAMIRYQVISPLLEKSQPGSDDWKAASERGDCSVKTIRRWVRRFTEFGLAGLARHRRSDRGHRRSISAHMQHMIEALYLERGYRSIGSVHRMVTVYARKQGEPTPSYTVVREVCNALSPSIVCMARQGERAWRNCYEPISRHESLAPNERWQMDHCKLDLLVIDPQSGQTLGRPWLTLVLDTYSRAVMGYHLSLYNPNSVAVCSALRQAIWRKSLNEWPMCGIPQQLHLDQGKDFTSRHLEQVSIGLGIQLIFATPYLARAKGKIERVFRTLNDQLWCELPGYVGPNLSNRPEHIEPSLTLIEAEHYMLAYLLAIYHQRPHTTTGEAPDERWLSSSSGFVPRVPESIRQLDLLLMMIANRKVHRDGIHLNSIVYWANELVDIIGQRVLARYDPQDLAQVVVYHQDRFFCAAIAPELNGLKVSLKEWHALQARKRKSTRATISSYQTWLDRQRNPQLPLALSTKEVDAAIILERLTAQTSSSDPAVFPSDRSKPILFTGGEDDND